MALTIRIPNLDPVTIPTNYSEIMLTDWHKLEGCDTTYTLLEALTGYDLSLCDMDAINSLGAVLDFLLTLPSERVTGYTGKRLDECTMLQVAMFERALETNNPNTIAHVIACVKPFQDPATTSVYEALQLLNDYTEQLNAINETWAKTMPDKSNKTEKAAGVQRLSSFGRWGMVYRLAGGDATKMPAIWDLPYKEVFKLSHYSYIEADIQDKMRALTKA